MKEKIRTLMHIHELDCNSNDKFIKDLLVLFGVSKRVAKKYAEFCVECDRKGLPLLLLDDYIEQYCC